VSFATEITSVTYWELPDADPTNGPLLEVIFYVLRGTLDERRGWFGLRSPEAHPEQNLWLVKIVRKSMLFKEWFEITAAVIGDNRLIENLESILGLQFNPGEFWFRCWAAVFLGKPVYTEPMSTFQRNSQVPLMRLRVSWETRNATAMSIANLFKLSHLVANNAAFLVIDRVCEIHRGILSLFSDYAVLSLGSGALALGYPGVQPNDRVGILKEITMPMIYRPSRDNYRMISPAFMKDISNLLEVANTSQELLFL
jgi:hypothetical protein